MSKVLAVMPTRNQSEYIRQAIETVLDGGVEELVIVNDASTDKTQSIIDEMATKQSRIHPMMLASHVNQAKAINAGIREISARGKHLLGYDWLSDSIWWTWVSSDNWYEPNWCSRLVELADEDTGAVYSAFSFIHRNNNTKHFTPHTRDRLIGQLTCYYGPCFLIRSDVWHAVGDHRGAICHDYDHWLRVEEACLARDLRIVGVDETLCHYRAHDKRRTVIESHSFDADKWQKEALLRRQKCEETG